MINIKSLHPYEIAVLKVLDSVMTFNNLVTKTGLQEIQAKRAIQWLENKALLTAESNTVQNVVLGENGSVYKEKGLPETRFLRAMTDTFTPVSEIAKKADIDVSEINIIIGTLKRKAAIDIQKDATLLAKLSDLGATLQEKITPEEAFLAKDFPIPIDTIVDLEKLAFDSLKTRKGIIAVEDTTTITVTPTQEGLTIREEVLQSNFDLTDTLTPAMLKDGSWKEKEFRHYDVESDVPAIAGGKRHFVNQAIEYMKQIWIELGFEEMSGTLCQTGFWDLDSLFVPQDHPARQMQDSFFLKAHDQKGILKGDLPEIASTVKAVHENGGDTGSKGWGGTWDPEFSKEVMLRTHTTALSAQHIANMLIKDKDGNIIPRKFFSVNKVFRNEAVDWKHLFEFNQVEGIVVDPNANFGHLLAYLKTFFKKMGFADVRIKPAHFPYTEPSAEIEVLNPKKNEWVELGGSGIFRPEVTKTLIGKEVPVLAWGLGMERIIVEYFELHDLRDLYKNDIKQLKEMKSWMRVSQ